MSETTLTEPVSDSDGLNGAAEGEGPEGTQNGSEEHSGSKLHREAAGYRVRLRETEAERDALAQKVERLQRAEIERLASDTLSHPADLFSLSGNEVADYLTEDGDVDAEKVAADVAAVLAERPGLRKQSPAFDPTQGSGGAPTKRTPSSWADLLKG